MRTVGAAVEQPTCRAAFNDEPTGFGGLSQGYARSGFAAAGVRYCYRVDVILALQSPWPWHVVAPLLHA